MTHAANIIGGSWQPAASGAIDAVFNPATGTVLGEGPSSDATEVGRAMPSSNT